MSDSIELTQSEWNVYSHLLTTDGREGVPTYEQIGAACGLRSKSQVCQIMRRLRSFGLVRHEGRKVQALTVIRAPVAMRPKFDRREARW